MGKRIEITQEIQLALDKLIQQMGSVYKLAQELGIAHSTILFWKSGKTTKISAQLWQTKLKFLLRPYMAADSGSGASYIRETMAEYGSAPQSFSLIELQSMGGFDPNVESAISYVNRNSIGEGFFSNVGGKTVFALRVDIEGFSPHFPCGTILLVESGRPACDGEPVLVKFRKEKAPRAMVFRIGDDCFSLTPFGEGAPGESVTWEKGTSSLSFIDWQFPVIEATIKLSSRKW